MAGWHTTVCDARPAYCSFPSHWALLRPVGQYLFPTHQRIGGWVGVIGWLHTKTAYPQTLVRLSTNFARWSNFFDAASAVTTKPNCHFSKWFHQRNRLRRWSCTCIYRVATNLEYSGISLNMGNSWNSRGILCILRENWLRSGTVQPVSSNPYTAKCIWCTKTVDLSNMQRQALVSHMSSSWCGMTLDIGRTLLRILCGQPDLAYHRYGMQLLPSEAQHGYLLKLTELLNIDNRRNWRFREELARSTLLHWSLVINAVFGIIVFLDCRCCWIAAAAAAASYSYLWSPYGIGRPYIF